MSPEDRPRVLSAIRDALEKERREMGRIAREFSTDVTLLESILEIEPAAISAESTREGPR